MASDMALVPIPFVTAALALVAAALVLRHDFGAAPARGWFAAFFTITALGAALSGLRFGYGIERMSALRGVVPLFVAPVLYLGFLSLALPPEQLRRHAAAHLGASAAAAVLALSAIEGSPVVDLLIGASFLVHALLLLRLWRAGPNVLAFARLEAAGRLNLWSAGVAGFLLVNLLFDTVIAGLFAGRRPGLAVNLIAGGAVLMAALAALAIVGLSRPPPQPSARAQKPRAGERDDGPILAAAEELMRRERLFADTELTADRLARRLHVPTRALSEAVNRQRGMSLSRYVNGFRLRHAAELLEAGDLDLAEVMARSGFLTRSNFYREFQAAFAMSPGAWRAERRARPADAGPSEAAVAHPSRSGVR